MPRSLRPIHAARWMVTVAMAAVTAISAAGVGTGAASAAVLSGPPQTVAGGYSAVTLGGLAVARDGDGAFAYRAADAGGVHIFLSRLIGGSLGPPVSLMTGPASAVGTPAVAVGDGGSLIVAWTEDGDLYAETAAAAGADLGAPQLIATGAASPSVSMNADGEGYLAYTQTAGSGSDVEVQYWNGSSWAPASPAVMNANAGDDAGSGSGAPSVWAATDGVAIVAWGEGGHIYSRRVWGTSTSSELEQDDTSSLDGSAETGAADPEVASGGDSTYPDIVFSETFGSGPDAQTRTMLTRLVAEDTEPAIPVDGLSVGGEQASYPRIAMGELGRGFISSDTAPAAEPSSPATTTSPPTSTPPDTGDPVDGAAATALAENGAPGAGTSVPAQPSSQPLDAVPAAFGSISGGVAWVQTESGSTLVQVRYAADGVDLAAPITLSDPAGGTVEADDGLLLAGDARGDGIATWVQVSDGTLAVQSAELTTPPGAPTLSPATIITNRPQPTLSWNAAAEDWGPLSYDVSIGGATAAGTGATSLTAPAPLPDGSYAWQVLATNAAGQSTASSAGRLIIDTYAPRLALRLTGAPRIGAPQHLSVLAVDAPNPAEAGAVASGLGSATVHWGDASRAITGTTLSNLTHRYARAGLFRIRVEVVDKAGNATTLTQLVRVLG